MGTAAPKALRPARRPGRWFVRVSLFGPFQLHLHAIQLAAGDPHGGHNLLFGKLSLIKAILAPGLTGSHHHQEGSGDGQPPFCLAEPRARPAVESGSGFLAPQRSSEFLFQPIHYRSPTPRRSSFPRSRADRKSTRLNSSHLGISYAVFCLKKKKT